MRLGLCPAPAAWLRVRLVGGHTASRSAANGCSGVTAATRMVFEQRDGFLVEEPGLGGAWMGVIAEVVGEAVARVKSSLSVCLMPLASISISFSRVPSTVTPNPIVPW